LFRSDNHFVPQMYLKKWSSDGYKIFGYRTLVSHRNVPKWNIYSIRGIAYQPHLYTRLSVDGETDEIERWLEKNFETPAEEAIYKATSNQRLSSEEWRKLISFAAAQSVRTPVQLFQDIDRWNKEMPGLLDCTLKKAVMKLEEANKTGIPLKIKNTAADETLPLRISRELSADNDKTLLKVETVIGRSTWLFGIKHLLTKTINILFQHNWSILHAAPDFDWITSDDPVLRLNYYSKGSYDFGGGWGNKGSEILLPLSPHHMLYTQVGEKNKTSVEVSCELCAEFQKLIAEHSYRWIFAYKPTKEIQTLRPREVDPIAYNNEMEAWNKWHNQQSYTEKSLLRKSEVEKPNGG